jgi:biotin operon repressor
MSAEATGWVFRHSPFKGATFAVHFTIADSVNDQHDNEFWMSQSKLAIKARCSRDTVNVALAALIEDGFLELVEEGTGRSHANRYRFLYPNADVVWEARKVSAPPTHSTSKVSDLRPQSVGSTGQNGHKVSEGPTQNPSSSTQVEPNLFATPPASHVVDVSDFSAFWERYPTRNGKRVGKQEAAAVWRRLTPSERAFAEAAVEHYRAACDGGITIAKDAFRWLRGRCWSDWQTPARAAPNGRGPSGPSWGDVILEESERHRRALS